MGLSEVGVGGEHSGECVEVAGADRGHRHLGVRIGLDFGELLQRDHLPVRDRDQGRDIVAACQAGDCECRVVQAQHFHAGGLVLRRSFLPQAEQAHDLLSVLAVPRAGLQRLERDRWVKEGLYCLKITAGPRREPVPDENVRLVSLTGARPMPLPTA